MLPYLKILKLEFPSIEFIHSLPMHHTTDIRLAHDFAESVRETYSRTTDTMPEIHVCRAADGAFGLDLVRSGP